MGEMLKEEVRHEGGRPKQKLLKKYLHDVSVLPDGISRNQSSRFQKAASDPARGARACPVEAVSAWLAAAGISEGRCSAAW